MCELEYEKAEIMLESYEEFSALEEKANVLRTYVEDVELFNEDATKQVAEKKQSLAKKAWDAVINFLKTIKEKVYDAIDKIKCKIDPNAKVYAIPKEYADKGNISKLQQCINKIKSITSSTPFKVIIAITVAIAGVCMLFKIKKQGTLIKDISAELTASKEEEESLRRKYMESKKRADILKYERDEVASYADKLRGAFVVTDKSYADKVKSAKYHDMVMITDNDLKELANIFKTNVDDLIKAAQLVFNETKDKPKRTALGLGNILSDPGSSKVQMEKIREKLSLFEDVDESYNVFEAGSEDGSISGAFTKLRGGINDLAQTLKSIGDDLLKLRMKGNK